MLLGYAMGFIGKVVSGWQGRGGWTRKKEDSRLRGNDEGGGVRGLAVGEGGGTLLDKGGHAFLLVGGGEH
jgi:hypothetical protein